MRGEGFVELRVARRVDHLVRQFVEDHARQFAVRVVDEGGDQRIAEPAQRRIRGHAADLDVVALLRAARCA